MVLVTGSTGFVGSNLCRALLQAGIPVRAFHRPNSSLVTLEGLPVEHCLGDITQPETLEKAMQGVEVVFHTAAYLGLPVDPARMQAVTVQGTRSVLEAARKTGVRRLVHTSTVAALGVPPPQSLSAASPYLLDENHTWNLPAGSWMYGYTKYLAELEVQKAVALGLDAVIVNPALVMGAGDVHQIGGALIIRMKRKPIPVYIPGGVNVIHIQDCVAGHLVALERGRTGERYILGGENLTHQALLTCIAEVAGVRPPRIALPGGLLRRLSPLISLAGNAVRLPFSGEALRRVGYYFYYNTLKAQSHLGFSPAHSTRTAIEEAFRWYQLQGVI